MSERVTQSVPSATRVKRSRFAALLDISILIISVLALLGALNVFAQRSEFRAQIDATKTRAYSLSEQTQQLLSDLKGDWTVAVLMVQDNTDAAVRRQIDEVLRRYTSANESIEVMRVDPSDPASLVRYESLLARLRNLYGEKVERYDQALDAGIEAFRDLQLFAQQHAATLQQAAQRVPQGDPAGRMIQQRVRVVTLLAQKGQSVLDEVDQARATSASRPIADYDAARSILTEALSQWATELDDLGRQFAQWRNDAQVDAELRRFGELAEPMFTRKAEQLAVAADDLRQLPELELSTIGRQLQEGEAAVVIGPNGAAVIPASQLFARSGARRQADRSVTFDRRFRGEQLISAAIRSLVIEHLPRVVFVHSNEQSLLNRRSEDVDLLGLATQLKSARFDVDEWRVPDEDQPSADDSQPTVWFVVPPSQRQGLAVSEREQQLISAVRALIESGENVLLSVHPSMLPGYGQQDPWAQLAEPFGFKPDTSRVIFESRLVSEDRKQTERGQAILDFNTGHAIGRALQGQQTYFALPVPIQMPEDSAEENVDQFVIAAIEPKADRWLESNWSANPDTLASAQGTRFDQPQPIVVAGRRPHPVERRDQRLLLVGSGGWMLSYIADVMVNVGGQRAALVNPGNYELAHNAIAWLADMDELIAESPTSRSVARLEGLTAGARRAWFWLLLVALPLTVLGAGLGVWFVRRR